MPPAYATAADLQAYAAANAEVSAPSGEEADRLLERCERDIDRVAGPWPMLSTGRKFDVAALPVTAREALRRATCAQAEFVLQVGVPDLVADDPVVAVAGVTLAGRPVPRVGVRALEELAGHGPRGPQRDGGTRAGR